MRIIQNRIFACTSKGLFYSDDYCLSWQNMIIVEYEEPVFDIEIDSMNILYASADYDIYNSTDLGNTWTMNLNYLTFVIKCSPENEIFAGEYRTLDQAITWSRIIPAHPATDISFKDSVTFIVADDGNTSGNLYREELNPYAGYNYFPLTIGNKWQYIYNNAYNPGIGGTIYTYSIVEKEVIGDTLISGILYYVINDIFRYYRYGSDNRIYCWDRSLSEDCVIMDFNLGWGDVLQTCTGDVFIKEGFEIVFDSERSWKGFLIPELNGSTNYSFADSIGHWKYGSIYGHYNTSSTTSMTLVNAKINFNDSIYYYSDYYKPQIDFSPIYLVDTLNLTYLFNVDHYYSKFSTNGQSRNFIKDVWIEYFYSKEDSSTNKDSTMCQISETSTNCSVEVILDSTKFVEGFKFYYAIYAKDKALIPQTSRSPEVDYYELVYDPNPNSVSGEQDNLYSFDLKQNYPNPFNPATSMQFTIGSRQFVTLKVYDILGREITTLVNEEKPAGEYEVEFNGTNLPSGIYFYQLKAGEYRETRKMILIK